LDSRNNYDDKAIPCAWFKLLKFRKVQPCRPAGQFFPHSAGGPDGKTWSFMFKPEFSRPATWNHWL